MDFRSKPFPLFLHHFLSLFPCILRKNWLPQLEDEAPVPVPAPGMVYQLVPIEDLEEEEEEVEDSEIEEGLVIEIAALDPAPAYTE